MTRTFGWRRAALTFCAFLLLPLPASGQERDLRALRDSLDRLGWNDLRALRARAATADTTGSATRHNALAAKALMLLAVSELSGEEQPAEQAADIFRRITDEAPQYVWGHFGTALAHLARPEVRIGWFGGVLSKLTMAQVAAEIVGQDPRSHAMRALTRTLEVDPHFEPAAVELARLALLTREPRDLRIALTSLKRIQAAQPRAETALWLADVAVAAGDLLEAEAAADALAATITDTSIVLHTRASILFRLPGQEARALAAYEQGIEQLTTTGAARYYSDVELLVTESERVYWPSPRDQRALEKQRTWLRSFWELRAAKSAVRVEQRIAEHYRRLDVARGRFRRSQKRGAPNVNSVLLEHEQERLPFDDRGLVYVLYGRPDNVIRTVKQNLHPNETWVYENIEGVRNYFHFVALRGGVDFTLVDDVFSAMREPTPDESLLALLEDRVALDPKYGIFVARLRSIQSRTLSAARSDDQLSSIRLENQILSGQHRRDVLQSLRTDHGGPEFAQGLPFYYDIFGLRGSEGRTELTAAFAVPGNAVTGEEVDGRVIYAIDMSLILIDTLTSRVERRDSTLRFWSSRPLRPDENIRFHIVMPTNPSTTLTHRVALRDLNDPEVGSVYGGPVEMLDYRGRNLTISDIVIADSSQTGAWRRDSIELELLPPRRIAAEQPFSLFYEIYNLPTGDPYRTELVIEKTGDSGLIGGIKRLFGGDDGKIRLSFEGVAASSVRGTQGELRRVAASLVPGRYRLRVTTTNLRTGQEAAREKLFLVIESPRSRQ